ncbi:CapA family protein [Sporolactobacillus shoreicorticis]|uniref:CapA family protein n=1 Tax=Sporolactobacillus shoreicorticis TaxID=1923877 RepID=A0ABW5S114_9BACL|nr:CapA family protein [Sporolactobacillus shoreicorticis]MCO7125334.1 CapA family protein [Sporolactobacillus shoreicorticis]
MNTENIKFMENLINELTEMDEEKIKRALEPFYNGTWKLPDAGNLKEKKIVEYLLKRLENLDKKVIAETLKAALEESRKEKSSIENLDPKLNRDIDKREIMRAVVLFCSYIFYDQFHYPQPQVGEYDIAGSKFEKLKWLYRYWFNQLEVAEKGSELEDYFRSQSLDFTLHDFRVESRVSLTSAGDLLAVDVLTPEHTPHLFDGIQDFYDSADVVCANLESTVDKNRPIGRTQEKGQPARMNTGEAMFRKFREEGGINYFSTANNHALDWGEQGVLTTLNVLKQSGAYHSGTNNNLTEQEDVLVIEKSGIKIAMLSYTFDVNGNKFPDGKSYLVNEVRFNDEECDLSMVKKHVARAKERKADMIIACCHWGWEFEMYPHRNVVHVARSILASGVDVILGNHPHVSQPMEHVSPLNKSLDYPNGLVVYGYGDFVSYHPESRNSKIAYMTKFDIVKGRFGVNGATETRITNLKMLPIYILNEKLSDGSYDCRILKFKEVYAHPEKYGLTELERSRLPHLNDVVLHEILLPKEHAGLLVE